MIHVAIWTLAEFVLAMRGPDCCAPAFDFDQNNTADLRDFAVMQNEYQCLDGQCGKVEAQEEP